MKIRKLYAGMRMLLNYPSNGEIIMDLLSGSNSTELIEYDEFIPNLPIRKNGIMEFTLLKSVIRD